MEAVNYESVINKDAMQGASIAALVLVWMLLADTAAATAAASTATMSHYAVAGGRPPTALTVAQVGALRLRGGGNTIGGSGEAITEEQAGEELIKAATANNIAVPTHFLARGCNPLCFVLACSAPRARPCRTSGISDAALLYVRCHCRAWTQRDSTCSFSRARQ